MKLHANARTCPRSRRLLVARIEQGWSAAAAAAAAGVSERTARKWLAPWRAEGGEGLLDRSSRPRRSPRSTGAERVAAIIALRRLRMTAAEIGEVLSMPLSTVSLVLKRVGLGKRSRLAPLEPANRYQRERPGELVHVDVKKLGRIARPGHRVFGRSSQSGWQSRRFETGWEYLHVCVDVECPRFRRQRVVRQLLSFLVHFLVVDRREVVERGVQSEPVVEALDVVEDGCASFGAAAKVLAASRSFVDEAKKLSATALS